MGQQWIRVAGMVVALSLWAAQGPVPVGHAQGAEYEELVSEGAAEADQNLMVTALVP